jgi:hypothetical protein
MTCRRFQEGVLGKRYEDNPYKELGYTFHIISRFTIEIDYNEFSQWLAKIPAPNAAVLLPVR